MRQPNGLEDAALWTHVAAGVDPLDVRHKNQLAAVPDVGDTSPSRLVPKRRGATLATGASPQTRPLAKKPPALPELDHGISPGVDKSTATRLKKGRQPIEGRLDLHGMTQQQAHPALDSFIEKSCLAGRRGVLVITGKGTKPDGSVGVLRQAVPRWLNLPPNRPRILAFSYATARDGGEGALYVLLKRKR